MRNDSGLRIDWGVLGGGCYSSCFSSIKTLPPPLMDFLLSSYDLTPVSEGQTGGGGGLQLPQWSSPNTRGRGKNTTAMSWGRASKSPSADLLGTGLVLCDLGCVCGGGVGGVRCQSDVTVKQNKTVLIPTASNLF